MNAIITDARGHDEVIRPERIRPSAQYPGGMFGTRPVVWAPFDWITGRPVRFTR